MVKVSKSGRDRGIALFAAIWIALLVTVFAVGVTRESRTALRVTTYHSQETHARSAAEAGIAVMQAVLAAQAKGIAPVLEGSAPGADALPLTRPVRLDGTSYRWEFAGAELTLRAEHEAGKLALNSADPEQFRTVLARLIPREADSVLTAILSKRGGASARQQISWKLGAQGFERVSDLASQPGVTRQAFQTIRPYLTVRSTLRQPDPMLAHPDLFAILPLDADKRRQHTAERALTRPLAPWPAKPVDLMLHAEAELPDGTRASLAALVRIDPRADAPVRLIRFLAAPPVPEG